MKKRSFSFCDSSSVPLLFPYQTQSQSQTERREMMMYGGGGFQAMLEGVEEEEEMAAAAAAGNKKRRLRAEQVGALERVFEEDSKLEPERKVKIAAEVGLEPRQVAIWFQNRRARSKTKQLERDFHLLRADYDSLHRRFNQLQQQRDALLSQLKGLKEELLVVEGNGCHHHNHHLPPPRDCGGEGSPPESDSSGGGSSSELVLDYYCNFNLQQPLMAASSRSSVQQPQCGKMEAEQQMVGAGGQECCNNNNNNNNVFYSSNIFSLDHPPNLHWYINSRPTADHYSYQ